MKLDVNGQASDPMPHSSRRRPAPRTSLLALLLLLAGALAPPASAGDRAADGARFRAAPAGATPIEGRYLVVLEEQAVGSPAGLEAAARGMRTLSEDLARSFDLRVSQVFSDALNAFVAEMDETEARRLARHPFVVAVEQDYSAPAIATDAPICKSTSSDPSNTRALPTPVFGTLFKQTLTCSNPSTNCIDNWGLDRIDEGGTSTDGKYIVNATGAGSYIFVLDTGINDHREWANLSSTSRVHSLLSRNFVGTLGTTPYTDWSSHGHGTHVAGIAAGRTYGVAKLANIAMLRVCSPSGNCTVTDIVEGLNFIAGLKGFFQSAVATFSANYSGWVGNTSLETAINGLHAKKVQFIQSAGNHDSDACNYSFGGTTDTVVVGGIDSTGKRHQLSASNTSNWGTCVDLWAPAQNIVSCSKKVWDGYCELTGTSMAAPHVAGALALYLAANPGATPAQMRSWLSSNATTGVLTQLGAGSPNKLLHVPY